MQGCVDKSLCKLSFSLAFLALSALNSIIVWRYTALNGSHITDWLAEKPSVILSFLKTHKISKMCTVMVPDEVWQRDLRCWPWDRRACGELHFHELWACLDTSQYCSNSWCLHAFCTALSAWCWCLLQTYCVASQIRCLQDPTVVKIGYLAVPLISAMKHMLPRAIIWASHNSSTISICINSRLLSFKFIAELQIPVSQSCLPQH